MTIKISDLPFQVFDNTGNKYNNNKGASLLWKLALPISQEELNNYTAQHDVTDIQARLDIQHSIEWHENTRLTDDEYNDLITALKELTKGN